MKKKYKEEKSLGYYICKSCGWQHFPVSLDYANKEVAQFNAYYDSLTEEQQELYYGSKKSHLAHYCFCNLCGKLFTNFRKSTRKEMNKIFGSTVSPILDYKYAKYEKA